MAKISGAFIASIVIVLAIPLVIVVGPPIVAVIVSLQFGKLVGGSLKL